MKHVRNLFYGLAVYGVAFLIASAVQAQTQGTAKVQAIRGSAQFAEADGAFKPLAIGMVLKSGATIRTATDSQVDLFLKQNGPVVRVTADTTLALDKLMFEETGTDVVIETQLNLRNGRILGNVKKLAAASKYEVKIPSGTVGIRGTEYDISAGAIVHIISGQALVTWISPTGQTFSAVVNAGQTFMPPPPTAPAGTAPTVIPTSQLPPGVPPPQAPPPAPPEGPPPPPPPLPPNIFISPID